MPVIGDEIDPESRTLQGRGRRPKNQVLISEHEETAPLRGFSGRHPVLSYVFCIGDFGHPDIARPLR